MTRTNNQERINKVYQAVDEVLEDNKITISDIIFVAKRAMEIVETFKDITGEQKKSLVLSVLRKYVHKTVNSTKKRDDMLNVINTVLPGTIDVIILASKGGVDINPAQFSSGLLSCFKILFRCF